MPNGGVRVRQPATQRPERGEAGREGVEVGGCPALNPKSAPRPRAGTSRRRLTAPGPISVIAVGVSHPDRSGGELPVLSPEVPVGPTSSSFQGEGAPPFHCYGLTGIFH